LGSGHDEFFDHTGTTDAILKERKSFVREAIQLFCYNDPTECKK
jgi:hypothetical protein